MCVYLYVNLINRTQIYYVNKNLFGMQIYLTNMIIFFFFFFFFFLEQADSWRKKVL